MKRIFFVSFFIFLFFETSFAQEIKKVYIFNEKIQKFVHVVSNEILVCFKKDFKKEEVDKINKKFECQSKGKLKNFNIHCIKIPPNKTITDMIEKYKKNPNVLFVEPNCIRRAFTTTPNDTYFNQQWGLEKIFAPQAWDIEKGKSSVSIAIIDTGVDYTHEDLKVNVDSTTGYDFANGDNDAIDDYGHGTLCAGITAADTNNGTGVAGTSWLSKIMPIKVLGGATGKDSDIANGIEYAADNGADIISLSLGGEGYATVIATACDYAYSTKGCLIVAAAGNYGSEQEYKEPFTCYPAALDTVIAVGATDSSDLRCSFSNYGSFLEVSAPGENIFSTFPPNLYLPPNNVSYKSVDGTSMATPFVAGVAALIWSEWPDLKNYEVREIIKESSEDIGESGWDQYTGHGRVNAKFCLVQPGPGLVRNYPNPFRPGNDGQTIVSLTSEGAISVKGIKIYNLAGELVFTVAEDKIISRTVQGNNIYSGYWSGKNADGNACASGIYFYVFDIENKKNSTGKIALIR